MSRRKALAQREPNGRIQRRPPDLPSPAEVSRLRDAALAGLRDAVWASPLGYLYLGGKISGSQFSAGRRWSDLARDYSAACQSPKAPRSANLEPKGGEPPDPDSAKGRREAARQTHVLHQHLAALSLLKLTGEAARRAVGEVCEAGRMPTGHDQLEALRRGLSALSEFWLSERSRK